jgi:RNA polymerase sigma-70 factor, ECF subfamily
MVFGVSWRILGNAADVEDNVQDVLFQTYQLGQTEQIRNLGGLLRRLATLGALARLRRRRKDVSLDEVASPASAECPEREAVRHELDARLRDIVAELPQREGAVFSLRYFEDLSLDEIAQTLDIKYSAAGAALSRARSKLQQVFDDVMMEESR